MCGEVDTTGVRTESRRSGLCNNDVVVSEERAHGGPEVLLGDGFLAPLGVLFGLLLVVGNSDGVDSLLLGLLKVLPGGSGTLLLRSLLELSDEETSRRRCQQS